MTNANQAGNRVYEFIVEKIKGNEWKPGAKIYTEEQLCKELGVSRISVRQAIEKLVALSVLKRIQGSGTYVEEIENSSILSLPFFMNNNKNVRDILEFRKTFEQSNTELFIKRCTQKDLDELQENYNNMLNSVNDMKMFKYYDNEFHNLIAKGTRNNIIIQISNIFFDVFQDQKMIIYSGMGTSHAIEYHKLISESIIAKNIELATIYTRMHIENSLLLLDQLESSNEN